MKVLSTKSCLKVDLSTISSAVDWMNWPISVCRCRQCNLVMQSIKTEMSSLSRVSIRACMYSALSSLSTLDGNTPNSHCNRFVRNRQIRLSNDLLFKITNKPIKICPFQAPYWQKHIAQFFPINIKKFTIPFHRQ